MQFIHAHSKAGSDNFFRYSSRKKVLRILIW